MGSARKSYAGAPRDGDRFVNLAGPRPLPGAGEMFPFLMRKAWTSLVGRSGAARLVPYDPAALPHNPSVTWIGHATMLVRMDGVTFLTDPIFSERASPVSFAGPQRLVPPGVPLDALPPLDFVTISHDHYDHADLRLDRGARRARRAVRRAARPRRRWSAQAGGHGHRARLVAGGDDRRGAASIACRRSTSPAAR